MGLDACLPDEPKKWGGVLPLDQLSWLDKELTDHADQLHLIVLHHNFIRWTADELQDGPKQWFSIDNDRAARALLSKHAKTAPVAVCGHRHIGLNLKEVRGVNYFIMPSVNSHPMRYTVFTITHTDIAWKTPAVPVPETVHLEARENLLNATWWRASQFSERNALNDSNVLALYENPGMVLGTKKL